MSNNTRNRAKKVFFRFYTITLQMYVNNNVSGLGWEIFETRCNPNRMA